MNAHLRFALALFVPVLTMGCSSAGSQTGSPLAPASSGPTASTAEPSVMIDAPATDPRPTPFGSPFPLGGSCRDMASADRCQALAFEAARQLGMTFDSVRSVDIVPNPSPDGIDFAHRTFLEVKLVDDTVHPIVVSCPGVSGAYLPQCMPDPTVPLGYPRGPEGGYTDIPENATPYPSLEAAAVNAARALEIDELAVPISATGETRLVLGRALLPNGYLASAHFGLRDPWPSDVLFERGISLEVTPAAGGDPLRNLYEHGWRTGVEEVEATITFDIAWFVPGATITLTDIVVR